MARLQHRAQHSVVDRQARDGGIRQAPAARVRARGGQDGVRHSAPGSSCDGGSHAPPITGYSPARALAAPLG